MRFLVYFFLFYATRVTVIGESLADIATAASLNMCEQCNSCSKCHCSNLNINTVMKSEDRRVLPNKKPWFNDKVRTLLRTQDSALKSGGSAGRQTSKAKPEKRPQ